MSKDNYYVDKAALTVELIEYAEQCKRAKDNGEQQPIVPDSIARTIINIAEGIGHRPNFINYSFREEMVSDGIENALSAVGRGKFDPKKSKNPFGYLSRNIWFAFLRRIDKEKKEIYMRHKLLQNYATIGTLAGGAECAWLANILENEQPYIEEFVRKYEENLEKKRAKARDHKPRSEGIEQFVD